METKRIASSLLLLFAFSAIAGAGEKVFLQANNGRFLRTTADGKLAADRVFPSDADTFELLAGEGDWVALRAADGRFVVATRHFRSVPVPVSAMRARLNQRRGERPETMRVGKANTQLGLSHLKLPKPAAEATDVGAEQPVHDPAVPQFDDPVITISNTPMAIRDELDEMPKAAAMLLVPFGENRAAIRARRDAGFALFYGDRKAPHDDPSKPRAEETLEVYRVDKIPVAMRTALSMAIAGILVKELDEKPYDKVKTKRKQKYIELPAPTLKDPGAKKRHRVLSYTEEFHVRARLGGKPAIKIPHMPYLKGYFDDSVSVIMFAANARIPLQGKVTYRIPDRLSATTGYQATVALSLRGHFRAEKTASDEMSIESPELLDIQVTLHDLRLSNDILDATRAPIEDFINEELREKNGKIRDKANKVLAKAVEAQEFKHPLLRFVD